MIRAKRSLSQNFLVDPNLQRKIVDLLEVGPGSRVLEVGPGHGELTRHYAGEVAAAVLVEKDDELAAGLREAWAGDARVTVVHGDILEVDVVAELRRAWGGEEVAPYRAISNVPYAITSPLIFRLLELHPAPGRSVLTVQKEVAERLTAEPGTSAYGALTVGVCLLASVRPAFDVSRHAFRPEPEVDSKTVVLEPRADAPSAGEREAVRRLTRAAFSRRRKQLQKILRSAPEYGLDRAEAESACAAVGVEPRIRPERLSPAEFVALARELARRG